MKKAKSTIITSETHEVLVIRRPKLQSIRAWCAGCNAEVEMLTLEEATSMTLVEMRRIFQWVEAGHIHFMETPNHALLICLSSLVSVSAGSEQQLMIRKKEEVK